MPKRGRRRKKSRTHVEAEGGGGAATALSSGDSQSKIPKSLVMRRGKTAQEVGELVTDMRRVMMPYTAANYQDAAVDAKLTLQQFCTSLALPMGISHILQFSQKEDRCNLRLARMPEGPTLSFRVQKFSLTRHIQGLQKRPVAFTGSLTTQPPITVTNNFGDHTAAPHIKLLRITFQNLFPQINVSTVKLKDCRRVVLFNLIESEDVAADGTTKKLAVVEMRHYAVKATPVGIDRKVRRLVQAKLPNLHNVDDIADYLTGQSTSSLAMTPLDAPSDSEPEDDPAYTVQLADRYVGAGCHAKQKSALKLVELGPRLTLQLLKVEKGLDSKHTPCLYHALIQKSPHEVAVMQRKKDQEAAAKQQRKAVQESNVEKKRVEAERKRENKRQRVEERQERSATALRDGLQIEGVSSDSSDDDEDAE